MTFSQAMNENFTSKSLYFAPLDGLTDCHFRHFMANDFDGFDYYMSEFLRLPSDVSIKEEAIIRIFGPEIFEDEKLKEKNILQILVSSRSSLELDVKKIANLGIKKLDLNCGCPSRTVISSKGGSYLLTDPEYFYGILSRIREHYPFHFSVKIRLGIESPGEVFKLVSIIERAHVDALFIHGRTVQMGYKGLSNWDLIGQVKKGLTIPVIGNGDIESATTINDYFNKYNLDGIMVGRGALRNPWIGKEFQGESFLASDLTRYHFLKRYMNYLINKNVMNDDVLLKRFKGMTCYLLIKEKSTYLLRSQNLKEFIIKVDELINVNNGI